MAGIKSPYQRHQKSPYRYSPQYYAWRQAVLRDGFSSASANKAGRDHQEFIRRTFGRDAISEARTVLRYDVPVYHAEFDAFRRLTG